MLPTKFRFIWPSGFRGEDFKKSANQKQELPVVAMFVNGSGRNEQSLYKTFHRCFLPNFRSYGFAVSEEKIKKVNRRRTTSDGKSSLYIWQGELKTTIEFACPWHVTVNNLKLLHRKIWGKFSTTDCSGKCDLIAKISLWTFTGIFFIL